MREGSSTTINMYRHSPVRNPRSKGIKIKHVLQGFLLVAICFWLIFQVKRSHDKKKEFDVHDNKISLSTSTRGSDEIVKLGRKDIQPKIEEIIKENEMHEDTQEDEEEHEDTKHEEEDQEEDKFEEEKDDGGGGGDDEIDENEQEKSDVEIDREEVDLIDEDKETEEREEKETAEKDGQSHTENEDSTVNHDEDGSTVHTNEAREENYKADDASSAVTHNGRNLGTKNESKNGTSDNSSGGDVSLVDNGQTAENTTSSNVTMTQEKDYESIVTSLNATSPVNFHDNGPPSGTSVMTSESTEAHNVTVSEEQDGNSSIDASVGNQLVPNTTLTEITEGSSNSTNDSEGKSSDPSKTEDETNEGDSEGENLDTNNVTEGTEGILDSDGVERDAIDSTDPSHLEEKEVRTDLDTLPDIEKEGSNSEDIAAE